MILFISTGMLVTSCDNNQQAGHLATKKAGTKESSEKSLEKVNRYLLNAEKKEIDDYVRRHRWKMQTTGSGLRYNIYESGTGNPAVKGSTVTLNYRTYLITGNLIYTSEKKGPIVFKVGHGGVETGLEEAVLLLHKGDKAHLIIPSHLAFGLNGDGDKIPKRASVIYDVELIDVK